MDVAITGDDVDSVPGSRSNHKQNAKGVNRASQGHLRVPPAYREYHPGAGNEHRANFPSGGPHASNSPAQQGDEYRVDIEQQGSNRGWIALERGEEKGRLPGVSNATEQQKRDGQSPAQKKLSALDQL